METGATGNEKYGVQNYTYIFKFILKPV